jgi:DnaJ-class molecular chaperone
MAAEAPTEDRTRCTPCRGTGQVISTLDGSAHVVTCPWCDGTGRWLPGHDAQADKRGRAG